MKVRKKAKGEEPCLKKRRCKQQAAFGRESRLVQKKCVFLDVAKQDGGEWEATLAQVVRAAVDTTGWRV